MTYHMYPVFGRDLLDATPVYNTVIPTGITVLDFHDVNSISPTFGVEFLLKVRVKNPDKIQIINLAPHLVKGLRDVMAVL